MQKGEGLRGCSGKSRLDVTLRANMGQCKCVDIAASSDKSLNELTTSEPSIRLHSMLGFFSLLQGYRKTQVHKKRGNKMILACLTPSPPVLHTRLARDHFCQTWLLRRTSCGFGVPHNPLVDDQSSQNIQNYMCSNVWALFCTHPINIHCQWTSKFFPTVIVKSS